MIKPITIDFETTAIEPRPYYPPKPTAVSILRPGRKRAERYIWGHPEGNNCDEATARRAVADVWKSNEPLLFQNAKFDVDVAQVHMGMPDLDGARVHDTLYLIFLHDPHAQTYSLKPSAERILGLKPEEQDVVKEWVLAHVPEAKRKKSEWGAYICEAPGSVVGPYMDGDCLRTSALFNRLHPEIEKRGMLEAYDRERRLMPILLTNEREGVCCDVPLLAHDLALYQAALFNVDVWLRKRLKAAELNIDSDNDFADALARCGVVTEFNLTAKGNRSVSKKNLTVEMFNDAKVAAAYGYRNRLSTCLGTFMQNWLSSSSWDGRVRTEWNQVRQSRSEKDMDGARTGRMSANGSGFMNSPKNWKRAVAEGYVYPKFVTFVADVTHEGRLIARKGQPIPDLPRLRTYFIPDDKNQLWGRRDFNQQELRIMAHFEDGDLCRHYNADPRFDHHQQVQDLLAAEGHALSRDPTKILNFQDIYGGGGPALAEALKITVEQAMAIKKAKRKLLPDFAELERSVKERAKAGLAIRTWGGREYFVEPPKYSEKFRRNMTFEYKMLNYLVQGSAADCTKEAICRWANHPKREARFLLTVHDEIDISCDKRIITQQMALLRDCMASVEFDVPMISDGEVGSSWGALEALKESA